MKKMFRSFIIISFIILNILILNWNFDLNAGDLNNEINKNSTSRFNNHIYDRDYNWTDIEVISEFIFGQNNNIGWSGHAKIAVEDENIYVVWLDNSNYNGAGGDYDVFFRHFDGNTWSEIQVISEPINGQDFNIESTHGPDIAVENGKIYVVWYSRNNTNNAGNDRDIFYRCNISGNNWEDIQVISEPVLGQDFNTQSSLRPKIAVENGKIYIVWDDTNNTNNSDTDKDIFFRCNLTGSKWEDIQVISEPIPAQNYNTGSSRLSCIAVENGNLYVTWIDNTSMNNAGLDYDIFYRCNLTGSNWEDIQVISEPIKNNDLNTEQSYTPKITIEDNKIFIVWKDKNDTDNAGLDEDIFYRCNLTGSSWEDIQVISEPIPGFNFNTENSYEPNIEVENGKIYTIWIENGNILFISNLTGSYWEPIKVISKPEVDSDFNTGQSAAGVININNKHLHIVWDDLNNINGAGDDRDVFYRSVPLSIVFSRPELSPTLGNTSTFFNFTVKYIHLENIAPKKIVLNISGKEYSILEVDPSDIGYSDGKDYYCNVSNLNIGLNTFYFSAFGGDKTKSSKIFNNPLVFNTVPNITTNDNLTAIEDVYYEVTYNYKDIDLKNIGQYGYWSFSTDANWLKFNHSNGVLNGTPTNDDVGEYWVSIVINDTMAMDSTNFILTVDSVNDPPTIITNDVITATEDEFYEVVYNAKDIDNVQTDLIWSIATNAEWLAFNTKTAIVSGLPTNNDVGKYWINISVSDTKDIDFSNFTLEVVNVNDPPKIITKDITSAIEDKYFEFEFEAEDIDNTQIELTWDFFTNAKWLKYNTSNSTIYGIPINDDVGEYFVNVSITDNEYIDYSNFTLTVLNSNDPPKIVLTDVSNATTGQSYSVNYEVEDIDPPPNSFTWYLKTNTSDWLSIDSITGWLTGIPSNDDVGIYWVNISVTDGEDGWDFHNFTFKILKRPVQKNNAPQLLNALMTPSEGDIKTEFTFSVHYFDEDGNYPEFIQLVINDAAYYMKLKPGENPSNGTYEHSTTLPEGTHSYYFTAFDGLESVKTNNLTTPDIKNIDKISTEEISWYWLFLVVIVIIIIALIIAVVIMKKRKAMKLPSVQAEMLRAPPEHIALPGATPSADIATPLTAQPIVSEQLPTPKVQVQPSEDTISSETISAPSLAPTTIETQFQLPKATLSKVQKLELLEERFLRGEVTEETYKELKNEIVENSNIDITLTEETSED